MIGCVRDQIRGRVTRRHDGVGAWEALKDKVGEMRGRRAAPKRPPGAASLRTRSQIDRDAREFGCEFLGKWTHLGASGN